MKSVVVKCETESEETRLDDRRHNEDEPDEIRGAEPVSGLTFLELVLRSEGRIKPIPMTERSMRQALDKWLITSEIDRMKYELMARVYNVNGHDYSSAFATQGDIALIQDKWPNIQPIPTPALDFCVENDEKFSTDVAPGQAGLGDSAGDELDGGTTTGLPAQVPSITDQVRAALEEISVEGTIKCMDFARGMIELHRQKMNSPALQQAIGERLALRNALQHRLAMEYQAANERGLNIIWTRPTIATTCLEVQRIKHQQQLSIPSMSQM